MTDPGWLVLVNFSVLAATTVLFVVNLFQQRALRRRYLKIMVLEKMLADLCQKALIRAHEPIWRAWAETMGEIEVAVKFHRRVAEDDDADR